MSGHHFTGYNIFKSVSYFFFERGFSEEKISVSALVDASWTCKIDAVSGLLKEKKKKKTWISITYVTLVYTRTIHIERLLLNDKIIYV